jgi:hypothetical protein
MLFFALKAGIIKTKLSGKEQLPTVIPIVLGEIQTEYYIMLNLIILSLIFYILLMSKFILIKIIKIAIIKEIINQMT